MQRAERILLIDDSLDDQQFFCEALAELHPHIKCDISNNGAEAMQIIDKEPIYDAIFLDLYMPKVNGFEFLQRLKNSALYKYIPVIVISSTPSPEDVARCKKLGADIFIKRPTSYKEVFEQLKNLLLTRA
jgi:CheY-like chemotaxis protein